MEKNQDFLATNSQLPNPPEQTSPPDFTEQDIQPSNPPQFNKNRTLYFLVAIFLFISLAFAVYVNMNKADRVVEVKTLPTTTPAAVTTNLPEETTYPTFIPPAKERIVLVKEDNGVPSTIEEVCKDEYCTPYVLWNDWYIAQNKDDIQGYLPLVVTALNLNTQETKVIFDISNIDPDNAESRRPDTLDGLYEIDDQLYISVGGYLLEGGIYWTNLPPQENTTHELVRMANPRMAQINGKYWTIGGEGDACWGMWNIRKLDLVNKKSSPVAKITSGCDEGETLIGFTKQDRLLVASFTGEAFNEEETIYHQVASISMDDPEARKIVIDESRMPANIHNVSYSADTNQIYLYGDTNYIYSFAQDGLGESVENPNYEYFRIPNGKDYQTIKDELLNAQLPSGYKFELQ